MPRILEHLSVRKVLAILPKWLQAHLAALHRELGGELYLAGGVVRDLLLGIVPADIDLTVVAGARQWAERLAAATGGAYVALGRNEDAARVVGHGVTVDMSAFREGATTILEELTRRDITINALGLRLDPFLMGQRETGEAQVELLDPTGGMTDLQNGRIRMASDESFKDDALRLLRVFRFAATLGFAVDGATLKLVERQRSYLQASAPERIAHELDLIIGAERGQVVCAAMAATGLLWEILPELADGVGMLQPKSHHLDVWEHNLESLRQVELIVADPEQYFSGCSEGMIKYLAMARRPLRLKWAALLHDLGKPATWAINQEKGGRITFYNHDLRGAEMFRAIARRLRWSNEDTDQVAQLIAHHMRPFHLANVAREGKLTLRACIRFIRKVGAALPGLFLLSMADALAGQGAERIAGMEQELVTLYQQLERVRQDHVEPVQLTPALLTGRDLIEKLHLQPGPLFKEILGAVEEARMEGIVIDCAGALRLAEELTKKMPVVNGASKGVRDAR